MMSNEEEKPKKSNWDAVDAISRANDVPGPVERLPASSDAHPVADVAVPSARQLDSMPDALVAGGFRTRIAAGALSRKAALQELHATYEARLEYLNKKLDTAVQVGKAQLEVQANEYLRELEAKHLEALAEIGIRNEDARARALIKLNDHTVERIREVQNRDWPDVMIQDTIKQILSRQSQTARKIMAELGETMG